MSHKQIGLLTGFLLFITAVSVGVLFSHRFQPLNQSSNTSVSNQSGTNEQGMVEGTQTNALVYGFNIPDYAGQYGINPTPVAGFDVNNNRIAAAIITGLKPMAVTNSYYDPPGRQTYINNRWELQPQNIAYWPKVISSGPAMVLSGSDVDVYYGDVPFNLTLGCNDPRVGTWLNAAIGDTWESIRDTAHAHPGANWFAPPHEPQNPDQISYSASVGQNVSEWMTSPRVAVCMVRKFVKIVRTADPTAKIWFPTLSTAANSRLSVDQWLTQFSAAEDAIPHIGDFDIQLKSIGWEGLALTWYPSPAGCRGADKYNPNCFLQSVSYYKALLSNPNSTYFWLPPYIAFAELGITHVSPTDILPAGCSSTDTCIASWFTTAWPQLASRNVKAAFFYALDLTWWKTANPNHGLCVFTNYNGIKTCPWTPVGTAFYTLSSQSSPASIPSVPAAVPTVCTPGTTTCQCPPNLSNAQWICSPYTETIPAYKQAKENALNMYPQLRSLCYHQEEPTCTLPGTGGSSPIFVPSVTPTVTLTPTVTRIPTVTPTLTPSPIPPSPTVTKVPTLTPTPTVTPTPIPAPVIIQKPWYCAIYPWDIYHNQYPWTIYPWNIYMSYCR